MLDWENDLDRLVAEQGWDDSTVLSLFKTFLHRQSRILQNEFIELCENSTVEVEEEMKGYDCRVCDANSTDCEGFDFCDEVRARHGATEPKDEGEL